MAAYETCPLCDRQLPLSFLVTHAASCEGTAQTSAQKAAARNETENGFDASPAAVSVSREPIPTTTPTPSRNAAVIGTVTPTSTPALVHQPTGVFAALQLGETGEAPDDQCYDGSGSEIQPVAPYSNEDQPPHIAAQAVSGNSSAFSVLMQSQRELSQVWQRSHISSFKISRIIRLHS